MSRFSSIPIILASLVITSCMQKCSMDRKDMSAEQVLETYLNYAFNIEKVEQVEQMLELTSGTLKAALASADRETLKKAYVDKNYQLISYSIIERNDKTPREVEITYLLKFKELEKDKDPEKRAEISTVNRIRMIRKDGAWYIDDALTKKTGINFPPKAASKIISQDDTSR